MEANELKSAVNKIDARTYDTKTTVESLARRVDKIEATVNEIYDMVKNIRSRYADEGQANEILKHVRNIEYRVNKM